MKRALLLVILLVAAAPRLSFAQTPISAEIAPAGKLRLAFNAGTAIMLTRTQDPIITGGVGFDWVNSSPVSWA